MVKHVLDQREPLDQVFRALADSSRREMVDRLTYGPASVSELALPFTMSLSAVVQHVQVLEACGLVRSQKVGRIRICRLEAQVLQTAEEWVSRRRSAWQDRFDRLGDVLADLPDDPEAWSDS